MLSSRAALIVSSVCRMGVLPPLLGYHSRAWKDVDSFHPPGIVG